MESQIRRTALAKLERKLSLPQYREYIDNEDAQMILMMDCLREAEMEIQYGQAQREEEF